MPFADALEKVIETTTAALADGKLSLAEIFRIITAVIGLLGSLTSSASTKTAELVSPQTKA
jgi:hypothetical protein